ncbi:hypothetical protein ACR78F_08700 [Sphingobacterium spiritivorum]|uniref:Uncharacterized protein n=1 Tax=Sphingobacterium spiritivorum ATCC 33861 TaxID=525373 RepID=D7VPN5_SPHSI|nr:MULTISPECIES: hypothetical protein [Sphingobacterium]EFK57882.1 hypothetical protein HMPREF0766_12955 [Sphingobacterium spiritivorum ATCC 33861]QQT36096.1 hypothetical protein I6J01_01325 [Sphingobacterium spiritivorum]WQD32829.1 hypothetical protein U0038_15025 [Sphingobacterium spiritivorum]SUJ15225.1 Uncharacterised protein [Sphingobacterium spiritivorum]
MEDQNTPNFDPNQGQNPNQFNNPFNQQNQEDLSTGLKVLSFCIPLFGAIYYFIKKDEAPVQAKSACKFAIYGVVVGIILNIISMVLGGLGSVMGG